MYAPRTLLAGAVLAGLAGCMDITGSGHPIVFSGTVRNAATQAPVPNATVEVYSNPFIGEGYRMESVKTDAQGRYTARIEEQRTYAKPNCAAMSMWVTADGYVAGGPLPRGTGLGTAQDPYCDSGSATVDVALTPLP